jgi:SAM-dependent methyltransferase
MKAVREQLREEHRAAWEQGSDDDRKRLALALGLLYGIPGVAERTGLVSAIPPGTVHSMTRGMDSETGGAYFLADMVAGALEAISRPLPAGAAALDFSCSSGRVVRPMAAVRPDVQWHGCDPNREAIEWAQAHVPGVKFFVSHTLPPLPFDDGALQLAFAISVWSHFNAASALLWLEEMHRVIAPGGHLLLTTHGLNSCVWFGHYRDAWIEARLGPGWIDETARRLQNDGHCFWNVFGTQGDWGVVDDNWGLAFFTPEWLTAYLTPTWSLRVYRIGRAQGNQDMYLLERT